MIRTSQPRIKITLIKTIRRRNGLSERYEGAGKTIDLEQLLDDNSSVTVNKNIDQAFGYFSIRLANKAIQPEPGGFQDSLYGWIEPMDAIEIRMGRDIHLKGRTADKLPIVMRGFISSIRRSMSMSADGRPIRQVIIEGQDYGKLLNIIQIFYQKAYGLGKDLLTAFKLTSNHDVRATTFTTAGFVQEILTKVVNPHLKGLQEASLLDVKPSILPDTAGVRDGIIAPFGFQSFEGTLWEMLRVWTDRYWNEVFIEDREDGVYLVCRQMPYRDLNGKPIDGAPDPGTVGVAYEHVKDLHIGRTDRNIANYYWVDAPRANMIDNATVQMQAYAVEDNNFIPDYPNARVALYGYRKLHVQTEQGESVPDLDEARHAEVSKADDDWVFQRLKRLMAQNRDNVLYEEGSATVRGDDALKPGRYLRFRMGSRESGYDAEYYCTGVTHEYLPYRSWVTRVELIRGNGYLARSEMAGSPYLAERGRGAYE